MLLNSKRHIDRRRAEVNMIKFTVFFYLKINVCHAFPVILTIKTIDVTDGSFELLDVLTSVPLNHSVLPRVVCFATSRPANHAMYSFIDSSRYASGPIRICLFIMFIIIINVIIIILGSDTALSNTFDSYPDGQ